MPTSSEYMDQDTLDMCGFFNVFSFVVSVYTLMASSIDRYLAVRWPIKYKQNVMPVRIMTGILLSITWVVGIMIALIPVMSPQMRYALGMAWMVMGVPDRRAEIDHDSFGSQGTSYQSSPIFIPCTDRTTQSISKISL